MVRLGWQCGDPPWVWVGTFSYILCPLMSHEVLATPWTQATGL